MYRTDFPDLGLLKQFIRNGFPESPVPLWPNVVIHAHSSFQHRPDIKGTLSLFTNLNGHSYCEAGGNRVQITPQQYFVSNFEQEYTLHIEQPVETFNLHFSKSITDDCLRNMLSGEADLIDNPGTTVTEVGFWNILYPKTPELAATIRAFAAEGPYLTESEQEERLLLILTHLFSGHHQLLKAHTKLPATKTATRLETLKRLRVAHDYIHSHYTGVITLEQLANAACMSKFHFLRLFKALYHCSPMVYISRLRIEKACELLQSGYLTTGQVSEALGFEHTSSFCRTFYKIKGKWPGAYIPDQNSNFG